VTLARSPMVSISVSTPATIAAASRGVRSRSRRQRVERALSTPARASSPPAGRPRPAAARGRARAASPATALVTRSARSPVRHPGGRSGPFEPRPRPRRAGRGGRARIPVRSGPAHLDRHALEPRALLPGPAEVECVGKSELEHQRRRARDAPRGEQVVGSVALPGFDRPCEQTRGAGASARPGR
jgi:hypothetical protein